MKKKLFVVLVISAGLVYFTSCKKDKEESGFVDVPFPTEQDTAADKVKLEANALLAVDELDKFADETGPLVINNFATFLGDADPMVSSAKSASLNNNMVFSTIYKLKAASLNNDASKIFNAINSVKVEDYQSFAEIWGDLKGIYTWNFTNKDWDYAASTTVAEFHFPSTENGTTNNAVFTISSFKSIAGISPVEEPTDLPTEVKANLKVGGTEYFAYSFAASYTNEGIPTSIVTSVAFRTFVFTFEFSNSTSNISVNYKFTNGSKTIFDIGGAVNGNFSQTAFENSDGPEDVFYNGNAHFQLFNVKIAGMVDVVKISEAEKKVYANEDDENFDYIKADSLMAIEINKNAKLIAFFTDTKQKIANVEAYSVTKPETYMVWVGWDEVTNKPIYEEVTEMDSDIEFRLVFADGSPADAENYFGKGFSDLVDDINALLAELNQKFDAGFKPIEK